jgi:hypothetical protein
MISTSPSKSSSHPTIPLSPRGSKPPEVAVEPKSPDDSFSFESEPPTISFQRPILLSLSPAERPTETTYSAITKILTKH